MVPWWVNNSPNIQELLLQPSQAYVNYPGTAFFVFHEPWESALIELCSVRDSDLSLVL